MQDSNSANTTVYSQALQVVGLTSMMEQPPTAITVVITTTIATPMRNLPAWLGMSANDARRLCYMTWLCQLWWKSKIWLGKECKKRFGGNTKIGDSTTLWPINRLHSDLLVHHIYSLLSVSPSRFHTMASPWWRWLVVQNLAWWWTAKETCTPSAAQNTDNWVHSQCANTSIVFNMSALFEVFWVKFSKENFS